MTKHLGNYVGFATDPDPGLSMVLAGVWNLFDQYRLKKLSKWTVPPKYTNIMTATGNYISGATPEGYTIFTFTGPGSVVCPGPGTAEVLLVGGGGGGGWFNSGGNGGGGGGAGGLVYVPVMPFTGPGTFPVTVGAGGNSARLTGTQAGADGSPSTINGFTALGGGFGAGYTTAGPTTTTGSSGTGNSSATPGDQPLQPQPLPAPSYVQYGNPSGSGSASPGFYDGGGGAGSPGATPTPSPNPNYGGFLGGGLGIQYSQFVGPIIGIPQQYPLPTRTVSDGWYAGGGAGGGYGSPDGRPRQSGLGGGGGSTYGPFGSPESYNGISNTGGGGAGGANALYVGSGGSGIVIVVQKT